MLDLGQTLTSFGPRSNIHTGPSHIDLRPSRGPQPGEDQKYLCRSCSSCLEGPWLKVDIAWGKLVMYTKIRAIITIIRIWINCQSPYYITTIINYYILLYTIIYYYTIIDYTDLSSTCLFGASIFKQGFHQGAEVTRSKPIPVSICRLGSSVKRPSSPRKNCMKTRFLHRCRIKHHHIQIISRKKKQETYKHKLPGPRGYGYSNMESKIASPNF